MGQSSSSRVQPSDSTPWPQVRSPAEFEARFRQVFGSSCLTTKERAWLDELTAKFGVAKESETYWPEESIVELLAVTLPSELQPLLRTTSPTLYRSVVRLGSFPYLNRPTGSLTSEHMRVALAILLQRHQQVGKPIGTAEAAGDERQKELHGMDSILFQSMATAPSSPPVEKETPASEEDGSYLAQAYQFVSKLNSRRPASRPTAIELGPPIIPIDELPPSGQRDLGGTIPRDQFDAWLQLVSKLAASTKGSSGEDVVVKSDGSGDVGWPEFEAALTTTPDPLDGLAILFTPFVTANFELDALKSADKSQTVELLQKRSGPSRNAKYEWAQ